MWVWDGVFFHPGVDLADDAGIAAFGELEGGLVTEGTGIAVGENTDFGAADVIAFIASASSRFFSSRPSARGIDSANFR